MKRNLLSSEKLIVFIMLMMFLTQPGFTQNLVVNADFEDGSVPSSLGQITYATGWSQPCTDPYMYTSGGAGADLMDVNATNPDVQIPQNNWTHGFELYEEDGDNRYAHLWQTENAFTGTGGAAELKGERITGTLTETLGEGCYSLCFWGSVMPHDATIQPGVFVDTNPLLPWDMNKQIIEVLLVNGNNCDGLLIYESPAIPGDSLWHQYCKNFVLSASEAGLYNRVLFRIKSDGEANGNQFSVFLDAVELINNGPNVNISGATQFCAGGSTTLTADPGFDNYLWSNGATTQSVSVSASGTYTVSAWQDFSECPATATVTVTEIPLPKITLPDEVSVCDENFQALCGPFNTPLFTFSYSWYYNDPVTMTSIFMSNNQCYVPTTYGSYTLIVTNQYGCTSFHTINVVEGFGPSIRIKDVYYCKAAPKLIGLPFSYADALAYEWTYDDGSGPVVIPGATGPQILNQGDGIYCLTIHWSNVNEPSLLGCTSTACFTVEQCCKPDPTFIMTYDPTGPTATMTVQNDPINAAEYDSEQFILYQYCGPMTDLASIPWTAISTTPWNTNFSTPVVFTGLDKDCIYKVVHRVRKKCKRKIFVSQQLAGLFKVNIFPNPVEIDSWLTVELSSRDPEAEVTIRHATTGRVVFTGRVTNDNSLRVEHSTFTHGPGLYTVEVSNDFGTTTEKVLVK